jgi:hypothetical protein
MDKWLKRKAPGDPPTPDAKSSIAHSVARTSNLNRKLSKKSATVVAQPVPVIPQVSKMTVLPPNSMHLILPPRKAEARTSSTNSILNRASAVSSAPTAMSQSAKSTVGLLRTAQEISKRNVSRSSETAHSSNQVDPAHNVIVIIDESEAVAASRSVPMINDMPPALKIFDGKCGDAVDATSDDSNDENNQRTLNIPLEPISSGSAEVAIKVDRPLEIVPKKVSNCLQLMKVTGRDGSTEMVLSDSDSSDDEASGCAAEPSKERATAVKEVVAEANPSIQSVAKTAASSWDGVRKSRDCLDSAGVLDRKGEGSDGAINNCKSGKDSRIGMGMGMGTGIVSDAGSVSSSSDGTGACTGAVHGTVGDVLVSSSTDSNTASSAGVKAVCATVNCSNSDSSNSNSSSSDCSNVTDRDTTSTDNSSTSADITCSIANCGSVTGAVDVVAVSTGPTVSTISAAADRDTVLETICTDTVSSPVTATSTDRGAMSDEFTLVSTAREVHVQGRGTVSSMPTEWVGFAAEECGHGEGGGEGEGNREGDNEGDDMSLVMDEDSLIFPPIPTDASINAGRNEVQDLTLPSNGTTPAHTVPGTLGAKSLGVGEILTHLMEMRQQTLDDFIIAGAVPKKPSGLVPNRSAPAPYIRDPLQFSGPLGIFGRKVFRVRKFFMLLVCIVLCCVALLYVMVLF